MKNIVGLTQSEALTRLAKFGRNEIVIEAKISPAKIFISQFKSFLILILVAAAILSIFSSIIAKTGDFLDAIFIITIVIINAILGFIQEYRAERAIAALKKMIVERVRVVRDEKETEIDAAELVPGDVFIVEEGKRIPADAQLLEGFNILTNEAPLTGESAPVPKEVGKGEEEKNLIFAGTILESGFGKAEVLATGLQSRFGKIAKLIQTTEETPTPLQKNLAILGKQLGFLGIAAAIFVILTGVFYGTKILEMLLTGASLAVAVVPEGLPAIVTITLAIGVQRMAKVHSIIRKLSSIEAIGSVDVICSDKTGTITKNEMVVKRVFLNQKIFDSGQKELENFPELKKIFQISVLCSTASLTENGGELKVLGDPTEGALLLFAKDYGVDFKKVRQSTKLATEFPFNPSFKTMSVIVPQNSGKLEVLTKGAPEIILQKSKKILLGGKVLPLSDQVRAQITKIIESESKNGFRLLAFGYSEIEKADFNSREEVETNLTFVGFVSIFDPPREEVRQALAIVKKAQVKVVMITGDNPLTALSIATEIGLLEGERGQVLTGKDLDDLSNEKLKEAVKEVKVFARVTPEHKLRIVKALQSLKFSVAVTGDGVNDAPALKVADVGMAMGIIGTDVAKEAADMVIADDNFASIVAAVEQGRIVYGNILKSIRYLLSCNTGELMAILGAVVIGFPSPLTPIQILWMNLVTDGLPALALAQDPKNPNVMLESPRTKTVSILAGAGKLWIVTIGLILGFATIASFIFLDVKNQLAEARTLAFTILVIGEMIVAFLARPNQKWNSNKFLILAVILIIILQIAIISFAPFQKIFDTHWFF